jgi:Mg2+ and Co2+ transporter CorA
MTGLFTMNSKCHPLAQWNFSRWFAVLSPLIGVLLGLVGAFL